MIPDTGRSSKQNCNLIGEITHQLLFISNLSIVKIACGKNIRFCICQPELSIDIGYQYF